MRDRKVKEKLSDLADIKNWWCYEKNGEIPEIGSSSKKKFWFKCTLNHYFESACGNFKMGKRCQKCAYNRQKEKNNLNTFEKVKDAVEWFDKEKNNISIESLQQRSETLVWFKCPQSHSFQMKCCYFYRGARCVKCAAEKLNTGKFIAKNTFDTNKDAVEWFDKEKNILPINKFPSAGNKMVWIKCPLGHSLQVRCGHFKKGDRCSYCSGQKPLAGFNTFELVKDAIQWWDNEKNTIKIDSITRGSSKIKVWMKCPSKGHSFEVTCYNFAKGSRCPNCNNKGYSEECIEWLECIERKYNIQIRHAKRPEREFPIPKTRYKADGWVKIGDKEYILEYHGYRWHGLKGLEKQDELNPHKDKTNAQAYADTIKKENRIKQLGYTLIVIWSDDYLANRDNFINGNFNIPEFV